MTAHMERQIPRASLCTIGCRLNQAETALLTSRLRQDGYEIVPFGQETDLLVLNSCSVTDNAEKDCRYLVRRTLRHSPQAYVAVTGCYAQTGAEALGRVAGIDLIVGNQYKMNLPDFLPTWRELRKRAVPHLLHSRTIERSDFALPGVADYVSTRAHLKIQDGCNFMCSFCIIPFARGRERSRRSEDVLREARALVDRGHREVVLTGVNIGQYRHEGQRLLDVIRRLEELPSLERIRISSIEPTTIPDALLDHMATSRKLCSYLHIPLQSGDDSVLQRMNRRYRVKDYTAFIDKAMNRIPDLCLGTDIMVGFPGEDEQAFANTLGVTSDLPFAYMHVFSYSERPGTAALRMTNTIPSRVVRARSRKLSELSRAKRLAFYQRYIGRKVKVLFEEVRENRVFTGLTVNYIRTAVSSTENLASSLREVVITATTDGLALGHLEEGSSKSLPVVCQ